MYEQQEPHVKIEMLDSFLQKALAQSAYSAENYLEITNQAFSQIIAVLKDSERVPPDEVKAFFSHTASTVMTISAIYRRHIDEFTVTDLYNMVDTLSTLISLSLKADEAKLLSQQQLQMLNDSINFIFGKIAVNYLNRTHDDSLQLNLELNILFEKINKIITSPAQIADTLANISYFTKQKVLNPSQISDTINNLLEKLNLLNTSPDQIAKAVYALGFIAKNSKLEYFKQKALKTLLNKLTPETIRSVDAIKIIYGLGNLAQRVLTETIEISVLRKLIAAASRERVDADLHAQLLYAIGQIYNSQTLENELDKFSIEAIKKSIMEQLKLDPVFFRKNSLGLYGTLLIFLNCKDQDLKNTAGNILKQLIPLALTKADFNNNIQISQLKQAICYLDLKISDEYKEKIRTTLEIAKPNEDALQAGLRVSLKDALKTMGHDFSVEAIETEKLIGAWHVDLYIALVLADGTPLKFIVEFDGEDHKNAKGNLRNEDKNRDDYCQRNGYVVLRLKYPSRHNLSNNIQECSVVILNLISDVIEKNKLQAPSIQQKSEKETHLNKPKVDPTVEIEAKTQPQKKQLKQEKVKKHVDKSLLFDITEPTFSPESETKNNNTTVVQSEVSTVSTVESRKRHKRKKKEKAEEHVTTSIEPKAPLIASEEPKAEQKQSYLWISLFGSVFSKCCPTKAEERDEVAETSKKDMSLAKKNQ